MQTKASFNQNTTRYGTAAKKNQSTTTPAKNITDHKVSRPKRDWAAYNKKLVQRGNVWEFLISDDIADTWKTKSGRKGRPAFTVAAIQACWMIRVWLKLPLRQTEGFITALFQAAGIPDGFVPEYSTLNKRAKDIDLQVPELPTGGVILIDGTGVAVGISGEWRAAKHGTRKGVHRRFVRVTATIDAETGSWTAVQVTEDEGAGTGEVSQVKPLLEAQAHEPVVLIGDGAYDNKTCYDAVQACGMALIAPPRVNAKPGLHPDRDQVLRQVQKLGTKEWKVRTGYHTRSLMESGFGAHKTVFGDRTRARTLPTQTADIKAAMSLHNYWLARET